MTTSTFAADIDLPSLKDLFNSDLGKSCTMYECECIDAEKGGEVGTFQEPNPEKTQIDWAARSEVVEIDHDNLTATVKVWF
ncbi:MAG: hypothetical protein AAF959_24695 [Cyanobacteria bacterium P01_D01_bin.56]